MKIRIPPLLLAFALSVGAPDTSSARSCATPVLENFPLIFHAVVLGKPGENSMSVQVQNVLSGREDRSKVLVNYAGVAVWSQSDLFAVGAEWIFAFDPGKSLKNGRYELVLCATDYLPVEKGMVTANLDGRGYKEYSLAALASQQRRRISLNSRRRSSRA